MYTILGIYAGGFLLVSLVLVVGMSIEHLGMFLVIVSAVVVLLFCWLMRLRSYRLLN